MATQVVNRRKEGFDVYIGRGSRWGNDWSHVPGTQAKFVVGSRAEAISCYRTWLWEQIKTGGVGLNELAALHGKRLGCYCAPQPCHGDVLAAAAAWAVSERLAAEQSGACRTCLGSGRVRSTARAVPGHVWSAQPCPSCRPGVV